MIEKFQASDIEYVMWARVIEKLDELVSAVNDLETSLQGLQGGR